MSVTWQCLASAVDKLLVPGALLWVGKWVTHAIEQQKVVDLEWVRAALDVLRDDSEVVRPLRPWALQIVKNYSRVPLDMDVQDKLRNGVASMPNPSPTPPAGLSYGVLSHYADKLKRLVSGYLQDVPMHDATAGISSAGEFGFNAHFYERPDHSYAAGNARELLDWARIDDGAYNQGSREAGRG